MPYIITGILVLIILYFVLTYNSLIKSKNRVEESFATMDVYLKKRWDIIPNLVEIVKGYVNHEENTLIEITKLRSTTYSNMTPIEKMNANEQLTQNINKLFGVVEQYPSLRASENFKDLSSQLVKVEEDISQARKYYNAVVREFNNKVMMFPGNIIAKIVKFEKKEMFEITDDERENVLIKF